VSWKVEDALKRPSLAVTVTDWDAAPGGTSRTRMNPYTDA